MMSTSIGCEEPSLTVHRSNPDITESTTSVQTPHDGEHGSSVQESIFNFTNAIAGAGALGLGGAFAASGGIVSIVSIMLFAYVTKVSLDLLIRLSLETPGAHGSYEDLGRVAFGFVGQLAISAAKFMYSFGCLVAYVIVVKENLGSAVRNLVYGDAVMHGEESWGYEFLSHSVWVTWSASIVIIFPLCLLRDMTPLANLSMVSVASMVAIAVIIVYLFLVNPHGSIREPGGTFYENWLEVRPGYLECLGTFVFTFVSQHTAHLAFSSLKPSLRTYKNWKRVSAFSIFTALSISLTIGLGAYVTFWHATPSAIFEIYPAISIIDSAKLLLCFAMLLTFPLPFFTCRELLIVTFFPDTRETVSLSHGQQHGHQSPDILRSLQEPLLDEEEAVLAVNDEERVPGPPILEVSMSLTDLSVLSTHAANVINSALLPGYQKQLRLLYHVTLTAKLWFVVTGLAIAAPSLGDVLSLVGCATGTLIAFVFPALLSLRLQGFNYTATLLLFIGGVIGSVGTYFSMHKLVLDILS
jgi:amino acid permease